nr:uncharacterized protein LOC103415040 [Malus domestica]
METVESNVDPNEQVMDILNDVYPYVSTNTNEEGGDDSRPTMDSEAFKNYEKLLKNAKQELYPGCENFSVLTAIVELMHGKIKFHLSNKCFDYFLGVIKRMLPKDNYLPKDHKSAQKVLKGLELGYEKIHACVNNCILFYKENIQLDKCPVCIELRFKMTSQNRKTKIPQKIMRYLPLKPRLQRLYMSMHTTTDMRWHKERRVNDDVMRHPADGEAWKEFDRMYPDFAADPRNIRLGLATDGFNPFGVLNQTHSIWPVVVFPYNLPPWKCMKKEYMMLTVLITEDPRKSIDVYLRPLVDELKDLWENGVRTYDKSTGHMFTMRVAVMWTVNDFLAYAMVSGWMTKGYLACPICKENVTSSWHARKVCYLGHRRWLPWDNEWRHNDKGFHGTKETQPRPREWSRDEILDQLNRLEFGHFGKGKNVFDTLVGTILDIEGKMKDTIEARLDLEQMGIRSSLWMKKVGGTLKKGHPFFTVKPNGKKEFFNFISSVKFPDGYASNISHCVNLTARCLRKSDVKQL